MFKRVAVKANTCFQLPEMHRFNNNFGNVFGEGLEFKNIKYLAEDTTQLLVEISAQIFTFFFKILNSANSAS